MVCVMGRLMYWLSKIESPETSYCGQFRRHTVRWPKRPRPRAAFAAPLARTLAASDELQLGRKPLKSSHRWAGARPVRRTQKFSYDNVVAHDGHVVAVFNIGVTGTDAIIKIVDHWTLRDGKAISLWAAYFEPQAVLEKLGIKLAVDGGMNA